MPEGARISVCMIVKDEADHLARCLESVKWADEIVVVDTGSTDGSQDIAREFGARVVSHPWQHHFSLHRNQALELARHPWILSIDADEAFFGDPDKVRAFCGSVPADVNTAAVEMRDVQGGKVVLKWSLLRLLRRGHAHFEGRVHNRVTAEGGAVALPDAYIEHYGYDLPPEKMRAKYERTIGLLEARLEDDPDDAEAYFYLCQRHLVAGETDKAIAAGEQFIQKTGGEVNPLTVSIYHTLFGACFTRKDYERAEYWLNAGNEKIPGDIDLAYAAMKLGLETQRDELLLDGCKRFREAFDRLNANPMFERGSRFCHHHSIDDLARVLHFESLVKVRSGLDALKLLGQVLPSVTPAVAENIANATSGQMARWGLRVTFDYKNRGGSSKT